VPSRPLPQEVEIEVGLDESEDASHVRERVAHELGIKEAKLPEVLLRKRSLDARRGKVRFRLLVELAPETRPLADPPPREVSGPPRVLIVGDGPAGLFCAYELARRGVAALVLDRGKPVQPRRRDLKGLNRLGLVDADSNYCFGEGGAGTYSDGKLYTRAHKRGSVRDVLEILAAHGAPEAILVEARPHIGSNRLPKVVTALRERLEGVGQAFRFGARVAGLVVRTEGALRRVRGVVLVDGTELLADAVVLATGHSARDVFTLLFEHGVKLEPKSFALGVRIEHPQPLVNRIQYGKAAGHPRLPAAYYRLSSEVDGRGVFSFCMCPGGWIVPASTEPGGLVVNGMSLSRRDSPFANSGLVVAVEPSDWEALGFSGPLGGVELQRAIERAAFAAGGGGLRAPATRVTDFLAGRASSSVPDSSYVPGVTPSDVASVLDSSGLRLSVRMRSALREFEKKMRGYVTEEAQLVGVESRTSAPVRVPRHPETLVSLDLAGLYPAGEGAGYAGGIVSAALDGMRVAERVAAQISQAAAERA
jgi:uncharacterized FAD-dependent dehydrogenase